MRCLIVEDYPPLRSNIEECLAEEGFVVDSSATGDEGLELAENHPYDVIVLDIMLPEVDGITIMKRLRALQDKTPVMIISARDGLDQRVDALNHGADDYLVKPFALIELVARLRALIRRRYDRETLVITVGDLVVDCGTKLVTRGGAEIPLTRREYHLLEYLAFRSGQPVSRKDIWEHVYEEQGGGSSNAVDVYIGYLRKKLNEGGRPELIHTKRGHGYLLAEHPA